MLQDLVASCWKQLPQFWTQLFTTDYVKNSNNKETAKNVLGCFNYGLKKL